MVDGEGKEEKEEGGKEEGVKEEGVKEEGGGRRREGAMRLLMGRKVSKPLAVVQGRPCCLAWFWRLRAVRSMAIVNAVFLWL